MVIFRRFTAGLLALWLMEGLFGCAVKLPEGTQTTAPILYPPHTCPADANTEYVTVTELLVKSNGAKLAA